MKRATVAIIILLLAGCGGLQSSSYIETIGPAPLTVFPVGSSTAASIAPATSTPLPMTEIPGPATETAMPSRTARINLPPKAGKSILLTSIQMIDPQNGWGFDAEYHILRTDDGGTTWQDVTPPTGYYDRKGFFALDAEVAWATNSVGLYLRPIKANVWRTDNGGRTWEASDEFRLDTDRYGQPYSSEFYLPQGMQFLDREIGWLLAAVSYNSNSTRSLFFHTRDGGKTWMTINSDTQVPSRCTGAGFVFVDPQTGWAGGNCFAHGGVSTPMKSLFAEASWSVAKTVDGGSTYEQRTLIPAPAELQAPHILAAEGNCGEIRLLTLADHMIGIEWGCSIDDSLKPDYKYFSLSANKGSTWTSWKSTGNEFFLHAGLGWRLLTPGELQQTTDGGLSWKAIKFVTWDHAQFDFVSEQEGWAIAWVRQGRAFLHTDNGGKTWIELHPRIRP